MPLPRAAPVRQAGRVRGAGLTRDQLRVERNAAMSRRRRRRRGVRVVGIDVAEQRGMPLDLDLELCRAAAALCARDRTDTFTVDRLLEFIRESAPRTRLASPLLAQLVTQLAEIEASLISMPDPQFRFHSGRPAADA